MMMDHWLIHCSLTSIKNKWYGKAFSVENSAEKEHVAICVQEQSVPPSGDDTDI